MWNEEGRLSQKETQELLILKTVSHRRQDVRLAGDDGGKGWRRPGAGGSLGREAVLVQWRDPSRGEVVGGLKKRGGDED